MKVRVVGRCAKGVCACIDLSEKLAIESLLSEFGSVTIISITHFEAVPKGQSAQIIPLFSTARKLQQIARNNGK